MKCMNGKMRSLHMWVVLCDHLRINRGGDKIYLLQFALVLSELMIEM